MENCDLDERKIKSVKYLLKNLKVDVDPSRCSLKTDHQKTCILITSRELIIDKTSRVWTSVYNEKSMLNG